MRQLVLDTETTGLEPEQGHRIIEIGCVELSNRRRTGRTFQRYLCPDRTIDIGAVEVHGLDDAFLSDKPRFGDVVGEFLEFVRGSELVIHNAAFDIGFLDHELKLLGDGRGPMSEHCQVLDTLALARRMSPGQRSSLDALCSRYGIDNSKRELHGALLDAEILADVYLAMTGGQVALSLERSSDGEYTPGDAYPLIDRGGLDLVVVRANETELEAHRERLAAIERNNGAPPLWQALNH